MKLPPNHRRAVIQGLRELADAFALNRDLPVPLFVDISYHPLGTDAEERAEVDRVAALLGVEPEYSAGGEHYSARCQFSAVRYEVIAISERAMAQHYARTSYTDNFRHITEMEQADE